MLAFPETHTAPTGSFQKVLQILTPFSSFCLHSNRHPMTSGQTHYCLCSPPGISPAAKEVWVSGAGESFPTDSARRQETYVAILQWPALAQHKCPCGIIRYFRLCPWLLGESLQVLGISMALGPWDLACVSAEEGAQAGGWPCGTDQAWGQSAGLTPM